MIDRCYIFFCNNFFCDAARDQQQRTPFVEWLARAASQPTIQSGQASQFTTNSSKISRVTVNRISQEGKADNQFRFILMDAWPPGCQDGITCLPCPVKETNDEWCSFHKYTQQFLSIMFPIHRSTDQQIKDCIVIPEHLDNSNGSHWPDATNRATLQPLSTPDVPLVSPHGSPPPRSTRKIISRTVTGLENWKLKLKNLKGFFNFSTMEILHKHIVILFRYPVLVWVNKYYQYYRYHDIVTLLKSLDMTLQLYLYL